MKRTKAICTCGCRLVARILNVCFSLYFITLRNGCSFKHYAQVHLLEEKIHSSHTKIHLFCLSLKVFTTLSVTKRSGENTLQAGC